MSKHNQPAKHPQSPPHHKHTPLQIPIPTKFAEFERIVDGRISQTMRTRAMLLGTSSMALNATQPTVDKTKKKRSRPVLDPQIFGELHTDIADRLAAYRERNYRNKVQLPKTIWDQMDRRSAHYMYANNKHSRVEFARVAESVLSPQFLNETRPLHWITLTPKQYGFDFGDAQEFNIARIQKWAHQMLPGVSFVGVVEGGCFPVQHASHSRIKVSFHVHLIGWGVSEPEMCRLVAEINSRYQAYVPRSPCAHAVRKQPSEAIQRVFYMTKMPLKSMRFVPKLERIDHATGEVYESGQDKLFKGPIRTGHCANMCLVMERHTLDRLAFCAGEGKPLLKTIRDRVLLVYRCEVYQRERRRWG